jgi:hypothetical protein
MLWVRIFCSTLGVNGGSARSWVRIFDLVWVNGGVVHVVESNLSPLGSMVVVHGGGFESLTFGGSKVV